MHRPAIARRVPRRGTFHVDPVPLREGLQLLAEVLPEQLPGDGVGAITQATYFAEIAGRALGAAALLDAVCDRLNDVMPIEFAAEPGATVTAGITGRGHVPVRLDERTPNRATFVTLSGHPLAGVMQLHAEDIGGAVRFNVHIAAQPANVLEWLALHAVGGPMEAANWAGAVQRVILLSGGEAPGGVQRRSHAMGSTEARGLRACADRIVQHQRAAAAR